MCFPNRVNEWCSDPCGQDGQVDAFLPAADGEPCGAFHQQAELPFIDAPAFTEYEHDPVF